MRKYRRCGCPTSRFPGHPIGETEKQFATRMQEMHNAYLAVKAAGESQEQAFLRRWEEAERRKQAAKVRIFLAIGVFFDGTLNNASNSAMGMLCGAHHPIVPEDLDASCKPYMADPDK